MQTLSHYDEHHSNSDRVSKCISKCCSYTCYYAPFLIYCNSYLLNTCSLTHTRAQRRIWFDCATCIVGMQSKASAGLPKMMYDGVWRLIGASIKQHQWPNQKCEGPWVWNIWFTCLAKRIAERTLWLVSGTDTQSTWQRGCLAAIGTASALAVVFSRQRMRNNGHRVPCSNVQYRVLMVMQVRRSTKMFVHPKSCSPYTVADETEWEMFTGQNQPVQSKTAWKRIVPIISQHLPTYLSIFPVVESSLSSPFDSGAGGGGTAVAFGVRGALGTGGDLGAEALTGVAAGSLSSVDGVAAGVASTGSLEFPSAVTILSQGILAKISSSKVFRQICCLELHNSQENWRNHTSKLRHLWEMWWILKISLDLCGFWWVFEGCWVLLRAIECYWVLLRAIKAQ